MQVCGEDEVGRIKTLSVSIYYLSSPFHYLHIYPCFSYTKGKTLQISFIVLESLHQLKSLEMKRSQELQTIIKQKKG